MRFILADENLVVAGRCYQGFPLLVNDHGGAIQPAQTWLWHVIGKSGRTESKNTWEFYGRAIYDYFAFVLVNGHDWRHPAAPGMPGAIEAWRDWSRGTLGHATSTVNPRLRIVVRFYEWAQQEGYIDRLPFDLVNVQTSRHPGFLAHVDERNGLVASPQIMLPEKSKTIRFLTKEQIVVCHEILSNPTHQLLCDLMVRTGLRQIEARTFPDIYVFDPTRRKDIQPGQKIRMHLDPKDMELKNNKPRDIDMPFDLMEALYVYFSRRRQARESNNSNGEVYSNLFLTESGRPYTKDAITALFRDVSRRVGFKVTAHMFRHSYATYLLWSLRKSTTFEGEPLLYTRDRLGHADVTTTAEYLHLINSLEGQLVLAHEDEIDRLFALTLEREPA